MAKVRVKRAKTIGNSTAPVWKAGKPIEGVRLTSLDTATSRARVCRQTPPYVFVDPERADSHTLSRLGLDREMCSQIPLRASRVEKQNGGMVFVESVNGVQGVEPDCLLTAEPVAT